MPKVLLLEMNEICFDAIEKYIALGKLPHFKMLFEKYGYSKTCSETDQAFLNPWVQWVTAHTGLDYKEHGVRRLSDVEGKTHKQLWENIEELDYSAAAFYSFNARNELKNAKFFVPDPWTRTKRIAPKSVTMVDDALKQITHDYAANKIKLSSVSKIFGSMLVNVRLKHIGKYLSYALDFARGNKWNRALFCDLLMSDVFFRLYKRTKPDFATVFINAGAHVQHHYMFSSKVYEGEIKNPNWYIDGSRDPVEEIYSMYDYLLSDMLENYKDTRLIIMTGLSQEAHDRISIYYRLKDHRHFLDQLNVPYKDILPLMTEDFVLRFETHELAIQGENILASVKSKLDKNIFFQASADDNIRCATTTDSVFYIDNRGDGTIYVQLRPCCDRYPESFSLYLKNNIIKEFEKQVDFVSVKNGGHNGMGYYIDTGLKKGELPEKFPLSTVFNRISNIFSSAGVNLEKD